MGTEVQELLDRVASWATGSWATGPLGVVAVGLAGSWARGAAGPGSDVDLVVLLADAPDGHPGTTWAEPLVGTGATDLGARRWGPVLERRFRTAGGLEVELDLAAAGWAALPADPGTARVVADGFVVLHDPSGLLGRLVEAVAGPS